jgi:hypothetical protein
MDTDILYGVDPILGKVNMAELKSSLGKNKTVWGGVCSEVTLTSLDREKIRQATRQAIETCAPGGGFVLSTMVWQTIPWQGVEMMIEAAQEFGPYPIGQQTQV